LLFLNQKELDAKPELRWLESVEEDLKNVGDEELETRVAGSRTVEDNCGRG